MDKLPTSPAKHTAFVLKLKKYFNFVVPVEIIYIFAVVIVGKSGYKIQIKLKMMNMILMIFLYYKLLNEGVIIIDQWQMKVLQTSA